MAEPTNELVVRYRDGEAARAAIAALERHGVDADHIRMIDTPGVGTPLAGALLRARDAAMSTDVGMRATTTALIGGIIGCVLGAFAAWFASGGQVAPVLGAAAGFFAAGGALGFFYGGASALSVSEEWADTFDATGEATLAVHTAPTDVIDLREVIELTDPVDIMIT